MCGALPLLPQRAFMTWTGKSLLFIAMLSVSRIYRDADKSLAQPGRKQANVSVRMA